MSAGGGDRARATPTRDLLQLARQSGVDLTERSARRMRARLGDTAARQRVEAIGRLLRAARDERWEMTTLEAIRRLDAAGSPERAVEQLQNDIARRRNRVMAVRWSQLERELWRRDAAARHAHITRSRADQGALAWQVEMLLAAARDAGVDSKVVDRARADIRMFVNREIARRFPVRDDGWTVQREGSRHAELVATATRDERAVRELALRRRPELHRQIEALSDSPRLRREIGGVLDRLRELLDVQVAEGWRPDPQRYRREVVMRARDEALAVTR